VLMCSVVSTVTNFAVFVLFCR